jgi:lipopolysaccharide/colanic/teichoic acid biosynthesis glycosyltransferase
MNPERVSAAQPATLDLRGGESIWGLEPRSLHDRLWRSRGVAIVRRGAAGSLPPGRTFLLVEPDDLVDLDLAAAERLRAPALLELRLEATRTDGCPDRVETDDDGELIAVRRPLAAGPKEGGTVRLTRDPALAQLWNDAPDGGAARRSLIRAVGLRGVRTATVDGRVGRESAPDDRREWLNAVFVNGLGMAPRDVRELQPRVLVHETAVIEPGALLVSPVWVGAGVKLERGNVVIGPAVIPDAECVAPAPGNVALAAPRTTRLGRAVAAARPRGAWGKRLFDIVFSAVALVMTAPFYLLIALAILIEDGRPIFFTHMQQSRCGRPFGCLKFRTMCRHADKLAAGYADRNQCDGPQVNLEEDPRVLRVGWFLRKTHLDELPQFINVLRGEMSVVGPRPSPVEENRCCRAWRDARLSVRPGVTGLWQVRRTRAPHADFQEWIRYDLEYVENRSFRLDLWILVQTVAVVLRLKKREGAEETPSRLQAAIRSTKAHVSSMSPASSR